jgi:hypothetical protein
MPHKFKIGDIVNYRPKDRPQLAGFCGCVSVSADTFLA